MALKSLLSATMAASALLASPAIAVDLNSKTNVAVYYGQGPYQQRLAHFCQQSSLDIIPISFVHIFPDQGAGGYPGTNFGNQCSSEVYENEDGVPTELLKDCHQIAEDIPICQAAGKTILLSLGGATHGYKIDSILSALRFADFLWGAFGPKTAAWGDKPRPFGDVVIDGFDFDIEHNGDFGYATMVDRLRYRFREDRNRKYYISAAPQCPPDDKQLAVPIMRSYFDFIFIQFYNTPSCSARSWVSSPRTSGFSFDDWVKVIKRSPNPSARLYIGLPGSVNATFNDIYYLSPSEVKPLAKTFMTKHPKNFGGIMLWEATYSDMNQINGKSYADHMKRVLYELSPPPPVTSTTKMSTSMWTTSYPASSETPYPSNTESTYPASSETPYPSNTESTYPASSETPYPSNTESTYPASSETPYPSNTESTYPASSETPYPSNTESTYPASSETPYPSNTESTYPASSETPYPSNTESTYPASSETPYPSNTESTYPASSETPYPSNTESTYPASSETPYPSNTESTYPASSETPYPSNTESTYPASSETPYPSNTESTYPASSETPYPSNTESTYPASSETPYPSNTETVHPSYTESTYPASSESPYPTYTGTAYPTVTETVPPYPTNPAPTTITTVITTSYTTICPTGSTTITTTYTTTYCPGTGCGTTTPPGAEPTAPPPVLPSSTLTPIPSYPAETPPAGGKPSTFSTDHCGGEGCQSETPPTPSSPAASHTGTTGFYPTSSPPPIYTGSAPAASFSGKWLVTLAVAVCASFFGM